MANGIVQVPPDSTGKKIDAASLDVGVDSVIRQRIIIGDNSATANFATVNAAGALTVAGAVNLSGTALVAFSNPPVINNISATVTISGSVNISATATMVIGGFLDSSGQQRNLVDSANLALRVNIVAGSGAGANPVSIAAGTANIGFINNISATVNVAMASQPAVAISGTASVTITSSVPINISNTPSVVVAAGTANIGAVSLGAGTANIGFINNISATVNVAFAGGLTLAAGAANIGSINNISATVTVAGAVTVTGTVSLGAGTSNIGSINNISATVNTVVGAGTANIGAVSLAAGTANIGFINGISATVSVVNAAGTANIGGVSLVSGTSNIGFINNISATVNVAIATPIVVSNISATTVTGLSYVVEKTSNSQVQVGDSANAAIRVNIVAGAVGGSGGTSMTDNASFDTTTTLFTPVGGIFDDAGTNALSENDAGIVRLTSQRGIHANLRTDGGVKMDDSTNSALRVNVVAGSAGGPSSNDNTTYSTGATAVAPAGYIFFSASATTMTDGRVGAARITDARAQHMNLRNNAGTEIGTAATPLSVKIENVSATANVIIAAGTANIGTINNISATVSVINAAGTANIGGVSLVAGTANIGFINNISATVNVAFASGISLAAGTANIGFINNISATVQVAIGTPFILQGISTTVTTVISNFQAGSGQAINPIDSANTALRVNVVAGSAGGPSTIDNTTFSTGATNLAGAGFIFFSASATTVTDGRMAAGRITDSRAQHVNLRNNAGAEIGTNAAPISVKIENQSATVSVINAAGTANIGAVSLAAGTANIGFINNISATVNTVIGAGTALIGAVSIAAGTANIGFINNISATVTVTGNINISNTASVIIAGFRDNSGNLQQLIDSANFALRVYGAGTNGSLPISGFNDASGTQRNVVDSANLALRVSLVNATATVTVTTANPWIVNIPSASHGPKTVICSTSATVTVVTAPGAGLHVYVTSLAVSNIGTTNTAAVIRDSANAAVTMVCAANGGGFVMNFDPPWKSISNSPINCFVNPNSAGDVYFNINFYVAA